MSKQENQEIVDEIEFQLVSIKDQEELYRIFRLLVNKIPNDMELGKAVRLLFTSNLK
jgi:hypothetical protein